MSRNILPRREAFEVLYHLNCDNLCSDFQEDLSFKFSLGLTCLVNRFMAAGNAKKRPVEVQLLIEILTYCRYVSGLPAGSAQAHVQLLIPRDPEQRVRDPEWRLEPGHQGGAGLALQPGHTRHTQWWRLQITRLSPGHDGRAAGGRAAAQDGGVARDRGVRHHLRHGNGRIVRYSISAIILILFVNYFAGLPLRADHVDQPGQAEGVQAAVRGARRQETQADRGHDQRQLQPPGPAGALQHLRQALPSGEKTITLFSKMNTYLDM